MNTPSNSRDRSVKLPVATVAQTSYTPNIPTQATGMPPPALIQQGDFVAYIPTAGTAGDFGAVSVSSIAYGSQTSSGGLNTSTGPTALYTALLSSVFVTFKASPGVKFAGISESQYRLNETYDTASQLNNITCNVNNDIWCDCTALVTAFEAGAYVTLDADIITNTATSQKVQLSSKRVNLTWDKMGSASGGTACTSTYAIGYLAERAPVGATKVKVRLLSALLPD